MSVPRPDVAMLDYGRSQLTAARDRTPPASGNLYDRLESRSGPGAIAAHIVFCGGPIPYLMSDPTMRHNFVPETPQNLAVLVDLASAFAQACWLAKPKRRSMKTLATMLENEPSPYVRLHLALWRHVKIFAPRPELFPIEQAEDAACDIAAAWRAISNLNTERSRP